MTVYFQGSELEAITRATGTATEDTTNFDATYSRAAASGNSTTLEAQFSTTGLTELWYHFYMKNINSNTTAGQPVIIYDSSGNQFVRFNVSGGVWTLQYWNGAAWTNASATTFSYSTGIRTFDIHVKRGTGTAGLIEVYVDGVLTINTGGFNLSNYADFQKIRFAPAVVAYAVSQVSIADTTTVGWNVYTAPPNAAGTDTDGTGAITDFNEITLNDATYLELTAAGQHRSTKAAARVLTKNVKGVTAAARAMRVDATGPQQIKPYVLISGTRYYGTTFALTTGFIDYQYTWNTNPATGVAWTTTEANDVNLEIGWEAVT